MRPFARNGLKNWKNINTQENLGTLFPWTGPFLIPINNKKINNEATIGVQKTMAYILHRTVE